jgi:hypothetical protein
MSKISGGQKAAGFPNVQGSKKSEKSEPSNKIENRVADAAEQVRRAAQRVPLQVKDGFDAGARRTLQARSTPTLGPTPTATPTPTSTPTPGATTTPAPAPAPTPVPRPTPVATPSATGTSASSGIGPVTGQVSERAADGLFLGADGQLYGKNTPLRDIPAVQPNPANFPPGVTPNNELIIHVNGIQNDVATQEVALQAVADQTGSQVIGIHNATAGGGFGFLQDVGQCALDKAGLYNFNPATVTMGQTIYKALQEGRPVHLMAHSQGALVTSGALTLVKNQLERDARLPGAQGEQARQMLERYNAIKVETFGGAAASYPAGPQYVHYINTGDPVPMTLGLGGKDDFWRNDITADARPSAALEVLSTATHMGNDYRLQQAAGGRGAVVHYVNDIRGIDPFANHDFVQEGAVPNSGGYIAQRVPFEDALRGQFRDVDTHR